MASLLNDPKLEALLALLHLQSDVQAAEVNAYFEKREELVDIWEVALPALELVSPKLRRGAIVACDNTTIDAEEYQDYFKFVNDPKNRFCTMTIPFDGGVEISVKV